MPSNHISYEMCKITCFFPTTPTFESTYTHTEQIQKHMTRQWQLSVTFSLPLGCDRIGKCSAGAVMCSS